MIVRKNKTYEINSLFSDSNWYENEDNYVIDETKEENQELIQKIKEHSPYIELVIEDGEIIDVIPIERPPEPELPEPEPTEEQKKIKELEGKLADSETANRTIMFGLMEVNSRLRELERGVNNG